MLTLIIIILILSAMRDPTDAKDWEKSEELSEIRH